VVHQWLPDRDWHCNRSDSAHTVVDMTNKATHRLKGRPSKRSTRRLREAEQSTSALVAEVARQFAIGRPVRLAEVRRLIRLRSLRERDRATLHELLGTMFERSGHLGKAMEQYRLQGMAEKSDFHKVNLATAVRDEALERSQRLLSGVKVTGLTRADRLHYWYACFDTAKARYDSAELMRLIRRVPAKDRLDPLIAFELRYARALIQFLRRDFRAASPPSGKNFKKPKTDRRLG